MKKLPPWLLNTACILAPILSGLSLYQTVRLFLPLPAAFVLYGIAFVCLIIFCIRMPKWLVGIFRRVTGYFRERFHGVELFFTNRVLRKIVIAIPGTVLGVIYAGLNAFLGIWYGSAWNGTLAGYFLELTGLRFLILHAYRKRNMELRIYRTCGMLLSVLSITLGGAVILLLHGSFGKTYPGFLVYAMAAYTFYKVYASIRGMVTARYQESLLLIAQRNIGHADALMSLLCLQTGLLNAFNGKNADFAMRMNGVTGGIVSLIVLAMGIRMILMGRRRMNDDSNTYSR